MFFLTIVAERMAAFRWTLEALINKSLIVYGDKYDFSHNNPSETIRSTSKVHIFCKICGWDWHPTVNSHSCGKSGCPSCSGKVRWTLPRFLDKAREIHGDKYDYDAITAAHIRGVQSHLPITCKKCDYFWEPQLSNHIHQQSNCPKCAGTLPWDLERFLLWGLKHNSDKFDYSRVTQDHFQGNTSKIPVKCMICEFEFETSIANHVNGGFGCPDCGGNVPWTLDRFLARAKKVHGDLFDYSAVTKDHVKGQKSNVP